MGGDADGGALAEAGRKDWLCPSCGQRHGFTFRAGHVTRLRLTVYPVCFIGDGDYTCPSCGACVEWRASAAALSRLMQARAGRVIG